MTSHDGTRSFSAGVLYPDGVFVKRMKASHILRTPPAIALQANVVEQLERAGCRQIRAEMENGRVLVTDFRTFLRHGRALNRRFGDQIALCLDKWQDAQAGQGDLFGGEI